MYVKFLYFANNIFFLKTVFIIYKDILYIILPKTEVYMTESIPGRSWQQFTLKAKVDYVQLLASFYLF